jgi:predicted DNA-binding antitoxin AbrB/MazE fold protein
MEWTIRAKFSRGVFEPLEPAVADKVSEGEEVLITIATPPSATGDPLRDTAGGWKDLLDAATLKRDIYADRLLATRPHVKL